MVGTLTPGSGTEIGGINRIDSPLAQLIVTCKSITMSHSRPSQRSQPSPSELAAQTEAGDQSIERENIENPVLTNTRSPRISDSPQLRASSYVEARPSSVRLQPTATSIFPPRNGAPSSLPNWSAMANPSPGPMWAPTNNYVTNRFQPPTNPHGQLPMVNNPNFHQGASTSWFGMPQQGNYPQESTIQQGTPYLSSLPVSGTGTGHGNTWSPTGPGSSNSLPALIVGPGFPPVSSKLVTAIIYGEYIELATLLEDLATQEAPSFSVLIDQLIVRPTKPRKQITDIVTWSQAFSVYTLVMTAYWPARVADLLRYQLLIMRTAQQFPGAAWIKYDCAFRREAAVAKLNDWSRMNAELFHFHISGRQPRSSYHTDPPRPEQLPAKELQEAGGSPSGTTVCHSWNTGKFRQRSHDVAFATRVTIPVVTHSTVEFWSTYRPLKKPRHRRHHRKRDRVNKKVLTTRSSYRRSDSDDNMNMDTN